MSVNLNIKEVVCFLAVLFCLQVFASADCVSDPTPDSCKAFSMPDSQALSGVTMNCNMMSWMTSCSLKSMCETNSAEANKSYCQPFNLLTESCTDMPNMGGCKDYKSMCSASGSKVDACNSTKAMSVKTSGTFTLIDNMCKKMPNMAVCKTCTNEQSCDLLTSYSSMCSSMSSMSECDGWKSMCMTDLGTSQYCNGFVNCLKTPNVTECNSYTMPNDIAKSGIDMNCNMMSFMSSCSIQKSCTSSSGYCSSFSLLKMSCIDMPSMMGCGNYNSMCASGSVVDQCSASVPVVPSTTRAQTLVTNICSNHNMEGCDACTSDIAKCDALTTYSNMCKRMSMTQCSEWETMCSAMPGSSLCDTSTSSSGLPEMRMYFHATTFDLVLFREWVTRTEAEYVGTWFACFFFSFFLELVRLVRTKFDRYLGQRHLTARRKVKASCGTAKKSCCGNNNSAEAVENGSVASVNNCNGPCTDEDAEAVYEFIIFKESRWIIIQFVRSFLYTFDVGLALLVMLIAMTFNVGWFLAVLAGSFFGFYIFQCEVQTVQRNQSLCC